MACEFSNPYLALDSEIDIPESDKVFLFHALACRSMKNFSEFHRKYVANSNAAAVANSRQDLISAPLPEDFYSDPTPEALRSVVSAYLTRDIRATRGYISTLNCIAIEMERAEERADRADDETARADDELDSADDEPESPKKPNICPRRKLKPTPPALVSALVHIMNVYDGLCDKATSPYSGMIGSDLCEDARAILEVPASIAGSLNAHSPDDSMLFVLEQVLGIQTLWVHDDNTHNYVGDQSLAEYPYSTDSFLMDAERGFKAILPLGFVMIRMAPDGSLSTYRLNRSSPNPLRHSGDADYYGFCIELSYVQNSYLLSGLFPSLHKDMELFSVVNGWKIGKRGRNKGKITEQHRVDYRSLSYDEYLMLIEEKKKKRAVQAKRRLAREARQRRAEEDRQAEEHRSRTRSGGNRTQHQAEEDHHGRHSTNRGQQQHPHEAVPPAAVPPTNADEDIVEAFLPAELEPESFVGATTLEGEFSDEQTRSRTKYEELIAAMAQRGCNPRVADMSSRVKTLGAALSIFGHRLTSAEQVRDSWFNDDRRREIIRNCTLTYKDWTKQGLHTDKAITFVKSPVLLLHLDHMHSFVKLCLDAIKEWDHLARDPDIRNDQLSALDKWNNGRVRWEDGGGNFHYETFPR